MKVLASTWIIGAFGLTTAAVGIAILSTNGFGMTWEWIGWGFGSVIAGICVTLGAIAREGILRSPTEKMRRAITTGAAGGVGIGAGLDGGGDGGGD
jgi:hypothetical protein